jgi:hypothetical protein
MTTYAERIKPTDYLIRSYLEDLRHHKYQIPTFQRDVVWSADSVKKLWDSIYRFYPIGSILIWKTDLPLHNHRRVGGHVISGDAQTKDFNYILDGQQRTTSLLMSLYGGEIEGQKGFDPTLYIDLSVADTSEIDETSYKNRFLFWNEIDDKNGQVKQNTPRLQRFQEGIIVKLLDVMEHYSSVDKRLYNSGHPDFDDPLRGQLREMLDVFNSYRLSFIELSGIEVSEVCQIFERINQTGKPLDIFDIVVAKTYRVPFNGNKGFYLRELIDGFRAKTQGHFKDIEDSWYLEMLATLIKRHVKNSGVYNITNPYLPNIKTEHIEQVWELAQPAILCTFDFFENHLHLKGPRLVPNRYLFPMLVSYFYKNDKPNYELLKRLFWFISLHDADLLTGTTHMWRYVEQLQQSRASGKLDLGRFLIDAQKLRAASYYSRGRLSTAILAFFANQEPRDWAQTDKLVLSDVYYMLTDKPNLHHVFPVDYVAKHPGKNRLDVNSLMNIVYLPQITNLQISNRNPINYLKDYDKNHFDQVLAAHLVDPEILAWARAEELPEDGQDRFIDARVQMIIARLKEKLAGVTFDVIDTAVTQGVA